MDVKQLLGERLFGKAFHKHSLIGDKTFFDPYILPVAKELEENYPAIRKEVEAILARYDDLVVFQDVSPSQDYIPVDDKWRMFFFKAIGVGFKRNQAVAPVTASIINKHKDICSAYISVLGPNTYLNPHKGPWSGIVRMHLGVIVPGHKQCALLVEEEPYHWEEGKVVLFDDTYEHMALNSTDKPRAILFLDIMRPLPQPWRFFNWMCLRLSLLTPYVIGGYFKHKAWQKEFFKGR
jgi:aspartyl/asparaginyl beta-hydroxylase (cupin superfamily)